jgi:hypothetical protein
LKGGSRRNSRHNGIADYAAANRYLERHFSADFNSIKSGFAQIIKSFYQQTDKKLNCSNLF